MSNNIYLEIIVYGISSFLIGVIITGFIWALTLYKETYNGCCKKCYIKMCELIYDRDNIKQQIMDCQNNIIDLTLLNTQYDNIQSQITQIISTKIDESKLMETNKRSTELANLIKSAEITNAKTNERLANLQAELAKINKILTLV